MEIDRTLLPTREQFYRKHVDGPPVLFTRGMEDWPAYRKWSFDWFKEQHGDVETQTWFTYEERTVPITIATYVDRMHAGFAESGYLGNMDLTALIPGLRDDLQIPDFAWSRRLTKLNFWLGPRDTLAHLHADFAHNLFMQIVGRKRVQLIAPRHSGALLPERVTWYSAHAGCDQDDGSHERELPRTPAHIRPDYDFIIEPGEMFFLPYGWWHRVRSLEPSISVNYWWLTPAQILKRLPRFALDELRQRIGRIPAEPQPNAA